MSAAQRTAALILAAVGVAALGVIAYALVQRDRAGCPCLSLNVAKGREIAHATIRDSPAENPFQS